MRTNLARRIRHNNHLLMHNISPIRMPLLINNYGRTKKIIILFNNIKTSTQLEISALKDIDKGYMEFLTHGSLSSLTSMRSRTILTIDLCARSTTVAKCLRRHGTSKSTLTATTSRSLKCVEKT